jgi:anthranilate phosphoribosyltransferase
VEAKEVLVNISNGSYNPSQISALVLRCVVLAFEELSGFREALIKFVRVDLSATIQLIYGTGGDGKDTLQYIHLASFAAAGAGIKVAKHGNYWVYFWFQ